MVLLGETFAAQSFDVQEVGVTIEVLDCVDLALQKDPVAGAQRHVSKIRQARATLAQDAYNGNVETRAETGVPDQLAHERRTFGNGCFGIEDFCGHH